jgi:NAD(P)-dependent dehydrogenase (short-subunit alcohol dehydrogenase family)
MLSANGRVIMITGANRGVGLALARCLHGKGYTLSLGARDVEALDAAVTDIAGERVSTHRYDAYDVASNSAWVEATVARFGRIDGLVNNAGISLHPSIEDADEDAYDAMWVVNVKGPLRMTRLALPHLRKSGSGRIVNVASLAGKRVGGAIAGYSMSKYALVALSHATRHIGWNDGVRVTALCPGWINTEMAVLDGATTPLGEMIQPEDLAELVATVMALPNTASISELPINCLHEELY